MTVEVADRFQMSRAALNVSRHLGVAVSIIPTKGGGASCGSTILPGDETSSRGVRQSKIILVFVQKH